MTQVTEHARIQRIVVQEPVCVSVVIPHFYGDREENFHGLLDDLKGQTRRDVEILVAHGIAPQGLAINEAVRASSGKYVVTIDDDTRLGHARVLENLIACLEADPGIGMAGASVVIPARANWFQREASRQFPRYDMPVVDRITDSDLPGHACSAFPKEVFVRCGMEREDILRGLDPDLRVRIRRLGYRVVLVPGSWIHHPMPDSLPKFLRVFLRNGYGSAYLQCSHPDINYDTEESVGSQRPFPKRSFFFRALRYPVRLIHSAVTLQWIRLIGYAVYLLGYAAGWVRFAILRSSPLSPASQK